MIVEQHTDSEIAYGRCYPKIAYTADIPRKSQWFNTMAFTTAAAGTFGTSPRVGVITLPGILNNDASFVKGVKLGEQRNLQLRADFFNLFLRYNPNPNGVGVSLNNLSTFGKLGGGTSDVVSRIIQLSAKLYF